MTAPATPSAARTALCPLCGDPMLRMMYFGQPGRLCERGTCVTGLAAYAPPVATETDEGPMFKFLIYEGSYWVALWRWLTRASP